MSDPKSYTLPALDPNTVPPWVAEPGAEGYPEPFRSQMGNVESRVLGDACGLSQVGVNVVVLAPEAQSALRHWHTLEDEFVYVLEGELSLVSDSGEQVLRAGMCAGFPAGKSDGHHLINRSARPARYLEIGTRNAGDDCFYPDDDILWVTTESGSHAAHKDGKPY